MQMIRKRWIVGIILILTLTLPLFAMGEREGSPDAESVRPVVQTPENAPLKTAEDSWSVYPPRGWVTDFRQAFRIAREENRMILLNYTGSDWCVWCHKLRDEVFNTPAFEAYAEENLVLLFLDFPSGITLPEEQIQHNGFLQALLGVEGFPTIWLLSSDLTPLLRTGYQAGGAEEYIRHLSEDRFDLTQEEITEFQEGFRAELERILGPL